MHAYLETVASPTGTLTFAVNAQGALVGLQFDDGHYPRTLVEELARGGYTIAPQRERTAARDELLEYAAGERQTFTIPVVLAGTAWQNTVWQALQQIPFGATRTYGQVAAMIGYPNAARAVGRANATNRIPLVIPCHRVLGANGALTGFAGGTHLKTRLLDHELTVLAHATRRAPVASK